MAFCAVARRAGMHQGKLVFSQLMAYLPMSTFRRCVARHRGDHKVKDFSCLDQFFAMAFAQLTYRESLRDIGDTELRTVLESLARSLGGKEDRTK